MLRRKEAGAMQQQRISFSGSPPPLMDENTPVRGWAAAFTAPGNPAAIRFVDVVGPHDLYFDAAYDRQTGLVSVWNAALPDFEALAASGSTALRFALRAFLEGGGFALSEAEYSITIRNLDDTPPTALAFASGGRVAPGEPGAVIGRLSVTDPDSSGPFTFTIGPADDWMYEVVDMELRLKPGISLALSDGPFRATIIEVSDGRNSAAFRLQFEVVAPGTQDALLDLLDPWEVTNGFRFAGPGHVRADRGGWEIATIEAYGPDLLQVVMLDGGSVWLPRVERIEFLNGTIDLRPNSPAAQVNALYEAVLARPVDLPSLPGWLSQLANGALDMRGLAGLLLGSPEFAARAGSPTNQQFITMLYVNTLGSAADTAGIAWWTGQLNAGVSRVDAALAFANWDVHRASMAAENPFGHWIQRPFANEVSAVYRVALNRLPEREGFEFWMGNLAAGRIGLADLALLFGRSDEFLGRFSGMTQQQFVRELYLTALGREPDLEGFNFWVGHLTAGTMQRHDMVHAFAFSTEMGDNLGRLPPMEPFL